MRSTVVPPTVRQIRLVTLARMVPCAVLVGHLDELLRPREFVDFGPNGLQVPGRDEVRTVATGVSASAELFERAAAAEAQLVLVHHGLFWDGMPRHIDRTLHRRLRPLYAHDMGLAAYHLPLDAHPEHGNNAQIAGGLGAAGTQPFAGHRGRPIGVIARVDEEGGIPAADLRARVEVLTSREPLHLAFGPPRVETVAIVSGGGSSYLGDAIEAGCDAFITGEPVERVMTQAREAGIHYFAAGHYATETFGVRRLGDLLSQQFGVRHVFIDDPNPI